MRRVVPLVLLASTLLGASEHQYRVTWKVSAVTLAAASTTDAVSSWRRVELNPILAGKDGRFGYRSLGIKCGITGGSLALQWYIGRRSPKMRKVFSYINFSVAGLYTAATVHNVRVR